MSVRLSRRTSTLAASGAAMLALAVGACVERVCDLDARSSLGIRVVDEDGVGVDSATVTASLDGGPAEVCEVRSDGAYGCPFFEQEGDFVVTVEVGTFRDTEAVRVGADDCHVITEQLVFEVSAEAGCCCAFIRPGDIDIISEEPTASTAECLARDQGSCTDPDTVAQRLTPHPCCPDATGDRCGG